MPENLSDTIVDMTSNDYKKRFKAEYWQLKLRKEGLENMLDKWDNGKLEFTPTCHRGIYAVQLKAMTEYMNVLEHRAAMEGISL